MANRQHNVRQFVYDATWLPLKPTFKFLCSKLSRREYDGQVECPLAWWWPSWHGWRTSWCPQTSRQGRPRWPLEGQQLLSSGISDQSWNPELSHGLVFGKGASWWGAPSTFGSDGSRGEPQSPACSGEVSWLLRLQVHSSELLWWPAACGELSPQLIYEPSALYEPFLWLEWREKIEEDTNII